MFKKAVIIAATTGALMLAGSPAFAGEGGNDDNNHTGQIGLINVNDTLNDLTVGVCDVNANVLAVQVRDVLNDFGLAIPVLSPASPSANETVAPDTCVADTEIDGH